MGAPLVSTHRPSVATGHGGFARPQWRLRAQDHAKHACCVSASRGHMPQSGSPTPARNWRGLMKVILQAGQVSVWRLEVDVGVDGGVFGGGMDLGGEGVVDGSGVLVRGPRHTPSRKTAPPVALLKRGEQDVVDFVFFVAAAEGASAGPKSNLGWVLMSRRPVSASNGCRAGLVGSSFRSPTTIELVVQCPDRVRGVDDLVEPRPEPVTATTSGSGSNITTCGCRT